jgi:hypothetical protein
MRHAAPAAGNTPFAGEAAKELSHHLHRVYAGIVAVDCDHFSTLGTRSRQCVVATLLLP